MTSNEFSVSILHYLITFAEYFQGKSVDGLSRIRLHFRRFLVFPEFVNELVSTFSIGVASTKFVISHKQTRQAEHIIFARTFLDVQSVKRGPPCIIDYFKVQSHACFNSVEYLTRR